MCTTGAPIQDNRERAGNKSRWQKETWDNIINSRHKKFKVADVGVFARRDDNRLCRPRLGTLGSEGGWQARMQCQPVVALASAGDNGGG